MVPGYIGTISPVRNGVAPSEWGHHQMRPRADGAATRERVRTAILTYKAQHQGRLATQRELRELAGLRSTGHVSYILRSLEAQGTAINHGGSRGWDLAPDVPPCP